MVVDNPKYWKQLYHDGKDALIALLQGTKGEYFYEVFGEMINAYESPITELVIEHQPPRFVINIQ